MGRWAEVYFTNPPEKRGQAVSELLRELEQIAVPATVSAQAGAGTNPNESMDAADSVHPSASGSEVVYTCGVCAYKNSAGHSFCGMCGAPLQVASQTEVPQIAEAAATPGRSWLEHSLDAEAVEETIEPVVTLNAARESSDGLEANLAADGKENRPFAPDCGTRTFSPSLPVLHRRCAGGYFRRIRFRGLARNAGPLRCKRFAVDSRDPGCATCGNSLHTIGGRNVDCIADEKSTTFGGSKPRTDCRKFIGGSS